MFLIPCSLSDLDNGYAGYCTDVCCDWKTEEICYNYDGYDDDSFWWESKYCAEIADGGCPCQENQVKCGQGKIILLRVLQMKIVDFISFILYLSFLLLVSDLDNGFAGYCTDVCCDQKTEETCYDYDGGTSNTTCAAIAGGGCPCPEGTAKCGQGKIILLIVANRMS
jgi:hypothetical protein